MNTRALSKVLLRIVRITHSLRGCCFVVYNDNIIGNMSLSIITSGVTLLQQDPFLILWYGNEISTIMWHSSTLWFWYSDIGYICTSLTDWLTVSYWWNLKGVSQWCHRKQFAMSLGDCKSKSWLAGRKGVERLRVWSRWCSSHYGWVLRQKPTAAGVSRVPSLHTLRRVHQEVRKHWANKYTWGLTRAAEGSMGLC